MAKRQKLDYNSEELTQNLSQSTGRGVDAFFPSHSPTAPANQREEKTAPATKAVSKKVARPRSSSAPASPPPLEYKTLPIDEAPANMVKEVKKEGSREAKKFTSKLVNSPGDPPVNKVGYYFTRKEIDRLDTLITKLKPIMRDRFNSRVTKNDIIRACLAKGINDWEENQLASELVHLLTSK